MTRKLRISTDTAEQTIKVLQQAGRRNSEGIVLWLGQRNEPVSVVSFVYQPIHSAGADFFHIPRQGMRHMMDFMHKNDVAVLAQVHSHPLHAFHSRADDEWAIVRHLGALSLVLPYFAREATINNFLQLAAVFALDKQNRWSLVPTDNVYGVLEMAQ